MTIPLVAAGCTGPTGGLAGTTPSPATGPTPVATAGQDSGEIADLVREIVSGLDPALPESLDRVEDLVALGRSPAPDLVPLVTGSESAVVRWAALYWLSRDPKQEDAATLIAALNDGNATNRALAAAALLQI